MNNNSTRLALKLVILGDPYVGKTSLVTKFMGKEFSKRYQKTFGSDISFKHYEFKDSNNNNHKISFSIWDIYGEATYKELQKQFLLGSQALLFVYDILNSKTFENITNWLNTVKTILNLSDIPILLVANKIDLRKTGLSTISTEQGLEFYQNLLKSNSLNEAYFKFIETSALTGSNVDKIFETLSDIVINQIVNSH